MAIAPVPMPRSARPGGYPSGNWWDGVGDGLARNSKALIGLGQGLLQGRNFAQGLALAGQGYAQGSAVDDAYAKEQEMEAERQERLAAAIENIRTKYKRPEIADWLEATGADGIDTAWQEVLTGMQPKSPIKASAGDVFLDPETYQPISSVPDPKADAEADKDAFGFEKDLYSQYSAADPVKTYEAVRNGYERVRASSQRGDGPGDISMIFAYMKMLDPTSVVREGEFATAENAGGVGAAVANIYNKLLEGERLTPELRQQFLAAADSLYGETSANLSALNEQFTARANAWNVDPSRFIRSPESYQPLGPITGTTSTGIPFTVGR